MIQLDRHDFTQIMRIDVAPVLLDAMKHNGCTVLRNALPAHLWRQAASVGERLFSIPEGEKRHLNRRKPLAPGFSAYGHARALDTGISNLLEGWIISPCSPQGMPPGRTDDWFILTTLTRVLRHVADLSLATLDFALACDGALIAGATAEIPNLQLLYYPKALLGLDKSATRQSVHVDSSILTVLPRASAPGLEIELNGAMCPVNIEDDEVLIIAGSVLSFLTCGKITAPRHTVTTPESADKGQDRLSIVYMIDPRAGQKLAPLASCSGEVHNCDPLDVDQHQGSYTKKIFGSPG